MQVEKHYNQCQKQFTMALRMQNIYNIPVQPVKSPELLDSIHTKVLLRKSYLDNK